MAAANRTHLHYLPFDKLDAVIYRENPGLSHPVILINAKASLGYLK